MANKQGWHWIPWGFAINGPKFDAHASSLSEAENEIRDAIVGTEFDRDDFTITPLYARAYRGPIDAMTPDPWSLEDGT